MTLEEAINIPTPSSQILVSEYYSEFFRGIANYRSEKEKVEGETGINLLQYKQGSNQRIMSLGQKDIETSLQGLPEANFGIV